VNGPYDVQQCRIIRGHSIGTGVALLIVSFVTEHDEIFRIYASRARAQTVEAILICRADGKQPGEG
jgi:hypothetical protein